MVDLLDPIPHTEYSLVRSVCISPAPQSSPTAFKRPTRYKIEYHDPRCNHRKWHRVYTIGAGNTKSPCIYIQREVVMLDDLTIRKLEDL